MKFLKVKSLDGYHIIELMKINYISPTGTEINKTKIILTNDEVLHSTETQLEIYDKIQELLKN